jgi:hypothetical protein
MRKLELVGLDTDGRYIVFADEAGDEYVAPADDRLRAALRGDRARLGQLEIDMDSALRPRDIQTRIRSGETPEAVAVVAQVSVDKIMPYCVPVLAERRHIAELARRNHVRRKNTEGPARSLDTVVSERLRSRGIDADATEWDAWRRDDGRWAVQARYLSGEREHRADFVFDAVGRYALALDDEAKWLTGEQSSRKGPQPREGGRGGERKLSSVSAGDDLLSLTGAAPDADAMDDDELTDDLTAVIRAVREPEAEPAAAGLAEGQRGLRLEPDFHDADAEATDDDGSAVDDDGSEDAAVVVAPGAEEAEPVSGDPVAADGPAESPVSPLAPVAVEVAVEPRRRPARRASVPSWDEIMLGKRKDDGA